VEAKSSICFEYVGKSFLNDLFGYNFKSAFCIKINPKEITKVEGISLQHFSLHFSDVYLKIMFGRHVSLHSE